VKVAKKSAINDVVILKTKQKVHFLKKNNKQSATMIFVSDCWTMLKVLLDLRFRVDIVTTHFVTEVFLRYFIELQFF